MIKQKGFLLLESSMGLVLACLGVTLLFYTLGQTKKIDQNVEHRIDRAYAWHVFNKTSKTKLTVHDHLYEKAADKKIIDKTLGKTYDVK